MGKTNADYVLKKLRKISFPLPRIRGKRDLADILREVEQIEISLKESIESMNTFKA